jgi:flagellar biosynthesis/type III secretory pathway M-ring protein FliF/YscJ
MLRRLIMQWLGLLRYAALLLLFLIVYVLILRPVKKQVLTAFRELPSRLAHDAKELNQNAAATIELPPGSAQAQRAGALKRQLADKVKTEPAAASRLVQGWIREDARS